MFSCASPAATVNALRPVVPAVCFETKDHPVLVSCQQVAYVFMRASLKNAQALWQFRMFMALRIGPTPALGLSAW